jgi:hypothetical protein
LFNLVSAAVALLIAWISRVMDEDTDESDELARSDFAVC